MYFANSPNGCRAKLNKAHKTISAANFVAFRWILLAVFHSSAMEGYDIHHQFLSIRGTWIWIIISNISRYPLHTYHWWSPVKDVMSLCVSYGCQSRCFLIRSSPGATAARDSRFTLDVLNLVEEMYMCIFYHSSTLRYGRIDYWDSLSWSITTSN